MLCDCHQWDANYIYLVMEYCSGGDLGHFIQARHTLSEHTARRFLQQLGKEHCLCPPPVPHPTFHEHLQYFKGRLYIHVPEIYQYSHL